jgi:hypothetical protein
MLQKSTVLVAFSASLFLMCCMILLACAAGPSHFRRSYDVSRTFEDSQPISGHQYYYNGLPSSPDAVVAIRKGYTLNSPHWHATDMDDKKLRHMVDEMLNNPGAEYNTEPNGAYIYNDRGDVIGAWYSVWRLPLLKFNSEKEFSISQPMATFPRSNRDPEERFFRPF